MKSIKIFAVAGAIGLLGMAGLSSCKQNSSNTPEYNGEVVKTEFSIAFPEVTGNNGGVLRMPGATVQVDESRANFRGMENIVLIPFTESTITTSSNRAASNITLPCVGTYDNYIAAGTTDISAGGSKVYTNVAIPIGTKGFLFYGKAIDNDLGTAITSDDDKHKFGILTPQNLEAATPATMGFELVKINTSTTPTKGKKIVDYLNQILAAKTTATPPAENINWNNCETQYPALYSFYTAFAGLTAGSSDAVERALTDLNILLENYIATGAAGSDLAAIVVDSIKLHATISGTPSVVTLGGDYDGYPADIYLPDGAAAIKYLSGSKKFELASTTNANGMTINEDAEHHGLTNFVYPPSLYYFANSAIKVANSSQADAYNSSTNWAATLSDAAFVGDQVTFTTRSVAIQDQIQYAVGRLDLRVKLKQTAMTDGVGSEIDVDGDAGIPVTAVLIGGQRNVDFSFIPNGTIDFTIYDKTITGFAAKSSYDLTNYTLALETPADKIVLIAIELQNNTGVDFIGAGGQLVPKGSKFYLLGTLDPTDAGGNASRTNTGNRVFKQDYKTIADLKLNADALSRAYNTIPDLRATNLELGLSVDLHWQTGMSFDVVL